jgi:DNA-binding MarR family transcriptional regulator
MEIEQELEEMAVLVPRLVGAFQRNFSRELARLGLTFPQFIALNALERFEGVCRMGPLAEAALQSAASMTGIVDRLLERGLVRRKRHPEDRRSVLVELTEQGRALLEEVREARRREVRRLLEVLPEAERRRLREIIGLLVAAMEKEGRE